LALQGLSTAAYLKAEPQLPDEHKAAFATHLAAALNAPGDSAEDIAEAESILRVIIWNTDGAIAESIAQAAANNPNIPNSLAWALANDDEPVAMPILESSLALSDADLVAIVESSENFTKMGAIARRPSVSADVSRSLALHGDENTAHLLLKNANADIPEDAMTCILDRHEHDQQIMNDMAERDSLSSVIAERLRSAMSPEPAPGPTLPRIDRTIMGYRDEPSLEAMSDQISQMIERNEITAELLVLKICQGYFEFFSGALASLAKLPKQDVQDRLLEAPAKHLPDFWKAGVLGIEWLPLAKAAMASFIFVHKNYSKSDIPIFRRNIVDRTMANLKAEKHKLSSEQVRFFQSL
jgi:uncharacterized protein (DUF2336 family)